MELQNDLLLRAARGEKTERVPVWMMRQAGRILKEYREVRAKAGSFIALATTPELAAEVTLQPVDILGVDAAIIFSDILVVPEAMGLPYEMVEAKGPYFPKTVKTKEDIDLLVTTEMEDRLSYVYESMDIVKRELGGRVPLIGFAGAPFTIFCYMIEGQGSKTFSKAKKVLYSDPEFAHTLLNKITEATISYLKGKVKHGADLLQIFDSWAGVLSPAQYSAFSIPYLKRISDAFPEVPVTLFSKGAFFARKDLGELSCDVVGLDWNMDIRESRELIPNKTLQGNLDPCVLYSPFSEVEKQTKTMVQAFGKERYIANLGHGVYPDTDPEKVKCFIETVKAC
ncbi:uroporphyrinogen decarboxylase [Leadbetterella byssophila]|uniref:Uroporphyrinogen decarboxylase n=1 Tax=Leadbetterella byssophila (strain DSM 17132 / JCM 16389 / KACC 11308 / NBRC 106382 / 4M15) TaxID=649349 RepID=E4RQW3_LEAB4|nr:uroporphyrinogen decarboxylase [Leadbetterella byssophila]ADQ18406.1 uroporphyrinogen decarboxylase [Leadbetterella byssophila DSM 17132]